MFLRALLQWATPVVLVICCLSTCLLLAGNRTKVMS
jgi:hypothetical protein